MDVASFLGSAVVSVAMAAEDPVREELGFMVGVAVVRLSQFTVEEEPTGEDLEDLIEVFMIQVADEALAMGTSARHMEAMEVLCLELFIIVVTLEMFMTGVRTQLRNIHTVRKCELVCYKSAFHEESKFVWPKT